MPLSIVLELLCALAINAPGRLAVFFRTVYFLPVVTSVIATALFSVIIYAVWNNLGYDIVIFMAVLSAIPSTFYEAARVDGATRWQTC